MKRSAKAFETVGETRIGIEEAGRLVEVHVERASDLRRPVPGAVWTGRVRRLAPDMGGAFVDLGVAPDGFLRFTTSPGAPRLAEGMLLDVSVRREAEPGKGPILIYKAPATHDAPRAVTRPDLRERLVARFPGLIFTPGDVPTLDELVQAEIALPGGGTIAIEPTRALVAVDVDKGANPSSRKVGEAAARVIARQLRLRGLGGLICIDFPNIRQPKPRARLEKTVAEAFAHDPDLPKIAPLSRFGVIEMTRTRATRSLDRLLRDTPLETKAIAALERLLREGRAHPGARLRLTVCAPVMDWLNTWSHPWRTELAERLGERFVVVDGNATAVEADR